MKWTDPLLIVQDMISGCITGNKESMAKRHKFAQKFSVTSEI